MEQVLDKVCFTLPTMDQVSFVVETEEEDNPIEDCCDAGDPIATRLMEDHVRRLAAKTEWGWCCVKVSAVWKGHRASDYLGSCSHESKADFIHNSGYYEDMKRTAYNELIEELKQLND